MPIEKSSPRDSRLSLALGISLVVFFIAVYFLTFSGYAISRDERFLFDATESIARHGSFELNYEYDAYPPQSANTLSIPTADAEPLQPVLAAPLFWLAQTLPDIGLAHTVWLFNVLITALIVGMFYMYGLALGYPTWVAWITALVLGLGTMIWPYSRTFFREPLFSLLALLSAYLMMRIRQRLSAGNIPWQTGIAFCVVFAGALLTKEVIILFVPVILVEATPAYHGKLRISRRTLAIMVGFVALASILGLILINMDRLFPMSSRYAYISRLRGVREHPPNFFEAVSGYMFSPGRSLWLFSPVLLLGFGGLKRLIQQQRWRQIAGPALMLTMFVGGYALGRGENWAGGLGWGPRYLLPVIPFLGMWLFPVVEMLRTAPLWQRVGAGAVFLLSAGIQIMAGLISIHTYSDLAWANGFYPEKAIWSLRWSPLPVYLDLLSDPPFDLAWQHAVGGETWQLPASCIILGSVALGMVWWWVQRNTGSRSQFAATLAILVMLTITTLGVGLYAIRQDPRYSGDFQPLHDLLARLEPQLAEDDRVALNDPTYVEFFLNYYKPNQPDVLTLPYSPGERSNPEHPPQIETANPDERINLSDTIILADLAQHHDRLWLVINSSRFVTWSTRPVEEYLTRHYFPVDEVQGSDIARAVLFDLTSAPAAPVAAWPEHRVEAVFGNSLQLVGYDIPGGKTRSPGDVVPLSLLWEARAPVEQDYTVAVYVYAPDGTLVAQRDSFPANYFEHTQAWRPGSLHRDNHGVHLPATLDPGDYTLAVAMYWWQTPAERLAVSDAQGNLTGDQVILATISVRKEE